MNDDFCDRDEHFDSFRSISSSQLQAVVSAIVSGVNIRSTVCLTGLPQNLVKAIVVQVGISCARHHQQCLSNANYGNLQCGLELVLREKIAGRCSTNGISTR